MVNTVRDWSVWLSMCILCVAGERLPPLGLHVSDYVWVGHRVDQNSALTGPVTYMILGIASVEWWIWCLHRAISSPASTIFPKKTIHKPMLCDPMWFTIKSSVDQASHQQPEHCIGQQAFPHFAFRLCGIIIFLDQADDQVRLTGFLR